MAAAVVSAEAASNQDSLTNEERPTMSTTRRVVLIVGLSQFFENDEKLEFESFNAF